MRKFNVLGPKTWLIAGLIATGFVYIFLLIDQLKLKHDCLPEDGMCNGGNTLSGDIYWALVLTLLITTPAWIIGLVVYFIVYVTKHRKTQ